MKGEEIFEVMYLNELDSVKQAREKRQGKKKKKKAKKTFSGDDDKLKGTRKVVLTARPHPSFLTFYFRVRAFSIQRTRLSRSLEQAI